jgi:hypothetical protein
MVVAGWALQALKAEPGIWDSQAEADKQATRVAFDQFPLCGDFVDGDIVFNPIQFATGRVTLNSNRLLPNLIALLRTERTDFDLVFGAGVGANATGIKASGKFGESVLVSTLNGEMFTPKKAEVSRTDGVTRASVSLSRTVAKGQVPWANLVEHQLCTLILNGEQKPLHFASYERHVKLVLEHELGRGLRTWQALFKEQGYLPTGLGAGGMGGGYAWDDMSDAGGYAHLISAGAQWLLYLEGKRDWEIHGLPRR